MAKHISCDCKCKFNRTTCNSNQKWNKETCRWECKNYLTCKKKIIVEILANLIVGIVNI